MPVYNGAAHIAMAIESVMSQTIERFELIVVQDGSTDATADIVAGYAAQDHRIRVVTNTDNMGLVVSLNLGLAMCSAPLVARLDADDWSAPSRLERQMLVFHDPSVVLSATGYERVRPDGTIIRSAAPSLDHAGLALSMLQSNRLCHSSVMFRLDAVVRVGGYDPAWFPAEDYDLWLRMMSIGRFQGIPTTLVRYLESEAGISRERDAAQRAVFQDRRQKYLDALGCSEGANGPTPTLWRAARRAIVADLSSRGIPLDGLDAEAYRHSMNGGGSRLGRHVATAAAMPGVWARGVLRHRG